MNPYGRWEFSTLHIVWDFMPAEDLAVFRCSGKTDLRGLANGVSWIMSRFPARFWLHDWRHLALPTIHKPDLPYLVEKHLTPLNTRKYKELRASGKDVCLLGERDTPRMTHGIAIAMEMLSRISPLVETFRSEAASMEWLIGKNLWKQIKRPYIRVVK